MQNYIPHPKERLEWDIEIKIPRGVMKRKKSERHAKYVPIVK
jgi:hypothetical protein